MSVYSGNDRRITLAEFHSRVQPPLSKTISEHLREVYRHGSLGLGERRRAVLVELEVQSKANREGVPPMNRVWKNNACADCEPMVSQAEVWKSPCRQIQAEDHLGKIISPSIDSYAVLRLPA